MRNDENTRRAVLVTVVCCIGYALLFKRCPTCGQPATRRQIRHRARRLAR